MYKAYIFDLDGTLTDTLESLTYSVNLTMKEMGFPGITQEQCRRFVGNGANVLIEKALRAGGDRELAHFDEAMGLYRSIFDENCTYHVKPYSGVPRLLEELKGRGMKLAILSNKPDLQTAYVAEKIFGKGLFDIVRGQREDVPRKPDPAAALMIAEALGADRSETLYIGDSEVDAETGRAACMDTVLVSWGFRSREELERENTARIADSADEIIDMIDGRRDTDE